MMLIFHFLLVLLATCSARAENELGEADTIYRGGAIVTMVEDALEVEALAVKDGRILAVGALDEVMSHRGESTRMVDLKGCALLPGFIDPHSHIAQYEMLWGAPDLSPPPVGVVTSVADMVRLLREDLQNRKPAPGELLVGNGYDDSLLIEGRHPTRHDLDLVSTNHPVLAIHASGHLIVANTAALRMVGYTRESPDPEGGLIRREEGGEPNGVCEELAGMVFFQLFKPNSLEKQLANLREIQMLYAKYGITTAQDGISMPHNIELLRAAAKRGELLLDIVSYPRWDLYNDVLRGERQLDIEYHPPMFGCCGKHEPVRGGPNPDVVIKDSSKTHVRIYQNRFKIGGIKITADGSPQGKTAFLTKPYVRPPEGQPHDYRGYATVPQEDLEAWFDAAYEHDLQLLVHCNGDAAADMMIAAARKAVEKHGRKDLRPVMIHAQMIRHDQVDAMAELGIVPSFFTAHTFYWGDWHIQETVGRERAFGMSPARYAATKGLYFTNHSDAPIVPPDMFMVMWTAVNRISRSGVVVGPDERLSALDALKAITINAARQYFEEHQKGSLEAGKLADLVILDRNPLTVDPLELKDLRALETIKEGVTIYRAAANDS